MSDTPRLSLTMIAKNEAPRIAKALESARKVCDELIVVDTGSTDGTQSIAVAMGARVIPFEWCDDFAAARNFALDQATADWCLVLDADDAIDDENAARINDLVPTLTSRHDAVFATYDYAHRDGVCVSTIYLQRIIRRTSGNRWVRRVHEYFDTDDAARLHAPGIHIHHNDSGKHRSCVPGEPRRTRRILEASVADGDTSTRTLWYLASELSFDGECDQARAMWESVAANDDASTFERYDSAKRLYLLAVADGDMNGAQQGIARMRAIDDKRPDAWILLASHVIDGGDPDTAIAFLDHAEELPKPNDGIADDTFMIGHATETRARAYAAKGDTERALAFARSALATHPNPDHLHEYIATLT